MVRSAFVDLYVAVDDDDDVVANASADRNTNAHRQDGNRMERHHNTSGVTTEDELGADVPIWLCTTVGFPDCTAVLIFHFDENYRRKVPPPPCTTNIRVTLQH